MENNRTISLQNDVTYFNLTMMFLILVVAVVSYAAPAGSNMLLPFACLLVCMLFSYTSNMRNAMGLSAIVALAYAGFVFAGSGEKGFGNLVWIAFLPLGSFLAAKLGESVSEYKTIVADAKGLDDLSMIDSNTGFYKNKEFFKRLNEEFNRARRYKTNFSLLIIKLSNYDELKKQCGDIDAITLLRKVAELIEKDVRTTDSKFMLDTDTLSLILAETGEDGAKIVTEKLSTLLSSINAEVERGVEKEIQLQPAISYGAYSDSDSEAISVYKRAMERLGK